MTTNNPFGPGGLYHDPFKREREQAEMIRRALGPGDELRQRVKELEAPLAYLKNLERGGVLSSVYDTADSHAQSIKRMQAIATPAWASSMTETARSIMDRSTGLVERQRRMSLTVLDTVRAFDAHRTTVASALAAANTGETFRRMIAQMLPQVTGFGAIAERMRTIDITTLRTGAGVADTTASLAAQMVIDTQRIAEAIAATSSEEEEVALFGELFETIAKFFARLGPNTVAELNNMGLLQWSAWLFGFLGLVLGIIALLPDPTPDQQAAVTELNAKYDMLQQETDRLDAADANASEAYLTGLQRAELSRDATLRLKPERAGDVVFRASMGEVVAIERTQGRWRLVVFRDPLSNQLARAWLYETALTPLAAPLGKSDGT